LGSRRSTRSRINYCLNKSRKLGLMLQRRAKVPSSLRMSFANRAKPCDIYRASGVSGIMSALSGKGVRWRTYPSAYVALGRLLD